MNRSFWVSRRSRDRGGRESGGRSALRRPGLGAEARPHRARAAPLHADRLPAQREAAAARHLAADAHSPTDGRGRGSFVAGAAREATSPSALGVKARDRPWPSESDIRWEAAG